MRSVGILTTIAVLWSLLLVFVGERVFGEGTGRLVCSGVGVAGLVLATAARVVARLRADGAARAVESRLALAFAGVLVSVGLYFFADQLAGGGAAEGELGLRAILAVAWPALLAVSLSTLLWMEAAWQTMPKGEKAELRRVSGAAHGGASLALAAVFLVSVNYAAATRNVKRDLSYFKTTLPSEGTLRMVAGLDEPVEVVLLYPAVNEVEEQLEPYFDRLAAEGEKLTVRHLDHALVPELARKHRVRGNGFVLITRGEGEAQQAESFEVGLELAVARSRLRTLDGRFQEAFARLVSQRRELHVVAGHDERSAAGQPGDAEGARIGELHAALRRSNIEVRQLGMAQGLANRVPEGAPAVALIGPRSPLLPEEADALLRYVREGGRLVVMLDPDVDHGAGPLLAGLGLGLREGVLCSETQHLSRTRTAADRGLVYSNTYSAHPTVTTASRNSSRLATVVVNGGALYRLEGDRAPSGVEVVFPVRVGGVVWRDRDGDYERAEDEPLEEANLLAAVTVPARSGGEEGRAVVIADGDFVTDQVIRNPGNAFVLSDIMQWLLGQEQVIADTSTEEDQLIEHTRDEDKLWFYLTSFGAPLPLLGLGVFVAMRRYAGGRREPAPRRAPAPPREAAKAPTEEKVREDEPDEDEEAPT